METREKRVRTSPSASVVFKFGIAENIYTGQYQEKQARQDNERECYAKPCLVIGAVEFHHCEDIGDWVSKTQNDSK